MISPEQEKKLQRILQAVTVLTILVALGVTATNFDVLPFASVLTQTSGEPMPKAPSAAPKKKVPRVPAKSQEKPNTPNAPETPETLGDRAFAKRDFGKAEAQYELAGTTTDSPLLRTKYVRSLLAQRKILEAKSFLDEFAEEKSAGLQLYRGILAALLNKQEESQTLLREITEQPFAEKARMILKAYEEIKFTVDVKPEHIQALLAKSFDEIGEYELAIAMALDAIKSKNDYRDAWVVLGHGYLIAEKWGEAAASLEKAISLDSGHAESHFYLAFAKRGQKKWQESYDHFENAVKLGVARNELLNWNEAEVLYELGRFKDAIPIYESVLSENGSLAKPEQYIRPLYILLEVLNQKEKGYRLAQNAVSIFPKEAIAYNLLGWAGIVNGKYDDARKNLELARSMDPALPAVYFNLGRLAEHTTQPLEAKNQYETALKLAIENGDQSIASAARNRLTQFYDS